MAPGLAHAEINDNDPITAFLRGVGDVTNTLPGRGNGRAQIKANVIDVAVGVYDVRREDDGFEDGVVGQINPDQLWSTDASRYVCVILHRGATGIQDP